MNVSLRAQTMTDDLALVERVRAGDETAFESVFSANYAELVRFASAVVSSQDIAEDLVSEVFVRLYERHEQWQVTTSIKAYLFSATRYRVINYMRDTGRAKNRYALLSFDMDERDVGSPQGPEELIRREEEEMQLLALEKALAELSPRSRLVVALRWRQQLSFEEIARIMKTSSAAVQMQLSRAMKVLRERAPEYLK